MIAEDPRSTTWSDLRLTLEISVAVSYGRRKRGCNNPSKLTCAQKYAVRKLFLSSSCRCRLDSGRSLIWLAKGLDSIAAVQEVARLSKLHGTPEKSGFRRCFGFGSVKGLWGSARQRRDKVLTYLVISSIEDLIWSLI